MKSAFAQLSLGIASFFGGERGIRTPGTFRHNGFQDRRDQPLCHLSDSLYTLAKMVFAVVIRRSFTHSKRRSSFLAEKPFSLRETKNRKPIRNEYSLTLLG